MDEINITLRLNGEERSCAVPSETTLQRLLHFTMDCREVRYGCGEGVCGTCTVLVDGKPKASCLLLAAQADGSEIFTSAALQKSLQDQDKVKFAHLCSHLVANDAFQCGYCSSGMVTSAIHHIITSPSEDTRGALSSHVCRCSGYVQIIEAVDRVKANEPVPGLKGDHLGHTRLDSPGRYPSDGIDHQTLTGMILWSEYPSAAILSIDVSGALAMDDVEAVITAKDIPGNNVAGTDSFLPDQPLLARKHVRSLGDVVALVAAHSEESARLAVRRIKVTYKELEPIQDVTHSTSLNSRAIKWGSNFVSHFTTTNGNVEEDLRRADCVVEGTYQCESNDHACLELEGGSGWFEDDTLVLSISSQSPHRARKAIAAALTIPEERIKIIATRCGGSFGKYLVTGIEAHLALLVHKTHKAVRLVLSRKESIRHSTKRHSFTGTYKLGLTRDGNILAMEADVFADAGPYVSMTPAIVSIFALEAAGAYKIPSVRITARGVLTNNLPKAPMRGFGTQQISFGIESIMEKAARELGKDPKEFRHQNLIDTLPDGTGREVATDKLLLKQAIDEVSKMLGSPPAVYEGWLHGRGISCVHAKYGFPFGFIDRCVASVGIDTFGNFVVSADLPDAGTGAPIGLATLVKQKFSLSETPSYKVNQQAVDDPTGSIFSRSKRATGRRLKIYHFLENLQTLSVGALQVVMGRLNPQVLRTMMGITSPIVNFFNDIINNLKGKVFPCSVDSFIPRIGGSRSLLMTGRAVECACELLEARVMSLAAARFNCKTEELSINGKGIQRKNIASDFMSWADLARMDDRPLVANGLSSLPPGKLLSSTGNQVGPVDFMDGAHGCDIALNPNTGEVRVLQYVACHDVGCIINANIVRGQIIGGIVMGISQALSEKLFVEKCRVENKGFLDYMVPTALDAPDNIKVKLLESKSGFGPNGSKGIGEAASVPAPNTIMNALFNALGVQANSMPVTPEQIVELAGTGRVKTHNKIEQFANIKNTK